MADSPKKRRDDLPLSEAQWRGLGARLTRELREIYEAKRREAAAKRNGATDEQPPAPPEKGD